MQDSEIIHLHHVQENLFELEINPELLSPDITMCLFGMAKAILEVPGVTEIEVHNTLENEYNRNKL